MQEKQPVTSGLPSVFSAIIPSSCWKILANAWSPQMGEGTELYLPKLFLSAILVTHLVWTQRLPWHIQASLPILLVNSEPPIWAAKDIKRWTSISFSIWKFVCVRNAGRQECNIRDRLKIENELKREEAGKWRERKERIKITWKNGKSSGAQWELKKDTVCKLFIHNIQKLWPTCSLQFL